MTNSSSIAIAVTITAALLLALIPRTIHVEVSKGVSEETFATVVNAVVKDLAALKARVEKIEGRKAK